jgi:hypothetical protein
MMRSLSTSAFGQPSDTSPTRGTGFAAARRDFGAGLAADCGMARLVAPTVRQGNFGRRETGQATERCSWAFYLERSYAGAQVVQATGDRQFKSMFTLSRTFRRYESMLLYASLRATSYGRNS